MEASGPRQYLSQAAFARHRGVSRKAVTDWKHKGLLSLNEDGLVDVEATEWNLDQRPAKYRGGVTHRPVRAMLGSERPARGPKPAGKPEREQPKIVIEVGEGGEAEIDLDAADLPLADAIRRKENFLGLQRKQAVEKEDRRLVDRAAAERLFFEVARDLRDAWASWPARVAIVMADELQVDPRALTTILTNHVHQHLAELGEPSATLG
ncbi:hypothetical protein [Methylobacterium sp. WSM2598]|uniref:hypothetical protein n=1 Tax=Methylobacterium sp. WSM2598 TaxID=398261 RepID=UPI000684351C|nr:hypothetical protein [Methylobacterium sp. WSM2598]